MSEKVLLLTLRLAIVIEQFRQPQRHVVRDASARVQSAHGKRSNFWSMPLRRAMIVGEAAQMLYDTLRSSNGHEIDAVVISSQSRGREPQHGRV